MEPEKTTLLTVSDAAEILDLTPDGVRRLSDRGDITTMRTLSGVRLFLLRDVKELAAEREGRPRVGRPRIHPRGRVRVRRRSR